MSIEAFAALMARDEPAVAPVLVGLAALIGEACGDDRTVRIDRQTELCTWIGDHAARLMPARGISEAEQLMRVQRQVAEALLVEPSRGRDPLLSSARPECVVAERGGHPLLVAALTAAVAEQAGLPALLVRDDRTVWLVPGERVDAGAIEFGAGRLVAHPACTQRTGLRWTCAHELAALLLDLVAEEAQCFGLHPVEVTARTMAMRLPLHPEDLQWRESELARARSVWN